MNQTPAPTATAPALTAPTAPTGPTSPRQRSDAFAFFREAARSRHTTGAVAPSGSPLARRLAAPLPAPAAAARCVSWRSARVPVRSPARWPSASGRATGWTQLRSTPGSYGC
ncbi:hypothetical protein O1L68_18240 [Streptomyces lydicus]|nr:hypothetical protein [Streptomyces lydicus]